jgi:SAM-dependent methyltransferase
LSDQIAGKEKIAEYFEKLLEKHGDHYLSLDWKSKESQHVRFTVLMDMLAYTDKQKNFSMLDVGCGIGHFYEYLNSSGIMDKFKIKYTGIDISQKMVEFAKKKFPGVDFRMVDLIQDKFDKKYDYVVSSGAFNIRMSDLELHKASVRQIISRMFRLCTFGTAVNFLSKSSLYLLPQGTDDGSDRYVYYSEEEVIGFVRSICDRYVLRKDYHPGDFTIYMLK